MLKLEASWPPTTSCTVWLIEDHTSAAPSTVQTISTETTMTMPRAIESRNDVFIIDHGSIRVSRSRARRPGRGATAAFSARLSSRAGFGGFAALAGLTLAAGAGATTGGGAVAGRAVCVARAAGVACVARLGWGASAGGGPAGATGAGAAWATGAGAAWAAWAGAALVGAVLAAVLRG